MDGRWAWAIPEIVEGVIVGGVTIGTSAYAIWCSQNPDQCAGANQSFADQVGDQVGAINDSVVNAVDDAGDAVNDALSKDPGCNKPSKGRNKGPADDVRLKQRLKRLSDKEAKKYDPHEIKQDTGGSSADLYRDPKTGKIYSWPRDGGEPSWVAGP